MNYFTRGNFFKTSERLGKAWVAQNRGGSWGCGGARHLRCRAVMRNVSDPKREIERERLRERISMSERDYLCPRERMFMSHIERISLSQIKKEGEIMSLSREKWSERDYLCPRERMFMSHIERISLSQIKREGEILSLSREK